MKIVHVFYSVPTPIYVPLNIQCIYWVFFFLRWFFTAAKRALRRNFGSTCGVKRVKRGGGERWVRGQKRYESGDSGELVGGGGGKGVEYAPEGHEPRAGASASGNPKATGGVARRYGGRRGRDDTPGGFAPLSSLAAR